MTTSALRLFLAVLPLLLLPLAAPAYEGDVHYGLTRWLALQAGFDTSQAEAIATADQRIDGGMLETTELALEYGCAARLPEVALQAQQDRYPAAASVPAAPERRAVLPGGDAARAKLRALDAVLKGKEGLLLGKFGEALHPLQDSWSHQGVPAPLAVGPTLACDAALAAGHAAARGGASSHAADLSAGWPADTLAMARATYEAMLRYPPVQGRARRPAAWDALAPRVEVFARASTKTQKKAWFDAEGVADTGFLGGTSLPDGPRPGLPEWRGWKLLPLPGSASTQPDADPGLRRFYDALLARWLGPEPVGTVAAAFGAPGAPAQRELAARLALWKLRDHGAAAELAHATAPLGAAQQRAVRRLARAPMAFVAPASVADAVFALQPVATGPEPLVAYVAKALPDASGAHRAVAILRLRHTPYDTLGLVAEQGDGGWKLVAVVGVVDM